MVGLKDWETNTVQATVVERTDENTLQGFVTENIESGAKVYTDEYGAYIGLENHEIVKQDEKGEAA